MNVTLVFYVQSAAPGKCSWTKFSFKYMHIYLFIWEGTSLLLSTVYLLISYREMRSNSSQRCAAKGWETMVTIAARGILTKYKGKKKRGGGGRIRMAKSLDRETMKPSSLELFKTWLAEARAPWSTFAVASVLASNWSTWLPEVPFNLNYTVCLHQVEFQQWNF